MFTINNVMILNNIGMPQFINELNKLANEYNISYEISKNDDKYSITINTTNTHRDEYLIQDIYNIILPLTRNVDTA